MNDGRLVRLVRRAGVLVLGIGIASCMLPHTGGSSAQASGHAELLAAASGQMAEQRLLKLLLPGEKPEAAPAAKLPQHEQEESELAAAITRMKETPFEQLDIKQLETAEVVATGYTAGKESTGKSPGHPEYGITFSGVKVRKDDFSTIAADPRVFPIGTIMYVPGYGFGVVADTGGAIKGKKIDLYFATKKQVYEEWGKRKVRVYVLRRGDGKVTEAMMNDLNNWKNAVPVEKQMDALAEFSTKK